jgi:hypothetical protein
MKANPIGLVVSAITAAITALSLFNDEVDETIEKQDELEKRTGASLENRFQARRRYSISQLQALRDDLEENKRINEEELSDFTATANAENEIIQNRIDFNKKEIEELRKGLAERIKNFGGNKKLIDLEKKDTQESIDLLEEKIKADEAELKVVKDSNPVIDKRIEQIKEINELLRQRRKESKQAGEKAPSVLPGVDLAEEQAENTKKFNDEILKGTEDTIEKTVEAVKDGADQVADIEDDKLDKQRERNRKMLEIAQEFYSEQGRARREQIDREIADSKRREDQLTQLAAGGSEEAQRSLALEQQRQSQLEQERRKSLSRQRQLAFGLAGAELIISNARQGSSDPAGKSLEQLSAFASGVSDIFKNLPAFETGGKVKGGEQIVRINEKGEEFVVKHSAVEKYGDKMLNDINNGTFDAFNYVQTPSGIVHQNFTTDFSNLERKVETLISEVKNKPVPYIAISEVTGGLKKTIQEGNKFTTQHFRKSNLF